jgi:zinc transporter ZupT
MSSNHTSLQILVFFAIILHKVPAAFGLSTFLIRTDTTKRKVRHIVLLFSLSAPIATILTVLIFSSVQLDAIQMQKWSSLLLLFSGGSFLYVAAVHIMPELKQHMFEDGCEGDEKVPSSTLASPIDIESNPYLYSGNSQKRSLIMTTISICKFLPLLPCCYNLSLI